MITIRTGKYDAHNILFVYDAISKGLKDSCWQIKGETTDLSICKQCQYRLGCMELRSAANHMLSLYFQTQKSDSGK